MTDHITIPRALLEQALANMVRAELLYGQPTQAIQEAIRAALSAPATAPEQPAWQDAPTVRILEVCMYLIIILYILYHICKDRHFMYITAQLKLYPLIHIMEILNVLEECMFLEVEYILYLQM
jgi:hypothetical protein